MSLRNVRSPLLVRQLGFLSLLVTPILLLSRAALTARIGALLAGLGAVTVAGGSAMAFERRRFLGGVAHVHLGDDDALAFVSVVGGAVLAHLLGVHAGLGPVLGSALVGLLAGVALPRVDTAAYCGSFVGMASTALFPAHRALVLAAALAGVAFLATKRTFGGYGGKLGTLAFLGCATAAALTPATYGNAGGAALASAPAVVLVAAVAAVVTAVVSIRLGLGAVVGSALVGVAAGIGFPLAGVAHAGTLATVAFCASFVGMSAPDRLADLRQFALAGAVSGGVYLAAADVFVGAGGKLGTVAFASSLAVAGARRLRR